MVTRNWTILEVIKIRIAVFRDITTKLRIIVASQQHLRIASNVVELLGSILSVQGNLQRGGTLTLQSAKPMESRRITEILATVLQSTR